jgi:hypothetical protein
VGCALAQPTTHAPIPQEKTSTSFLKKSSKKLLIPPAFEWPQFGHSKAGDNQESFQKSSACLVCH